MDVPMPVAAAAEQIVQELDGLKGNEVDFAALLELAAEASGLSWSPRTSRSTTA